MPFADFIGLVCGAITGKVYAIINPDSDFELDNPRWLLIQVQVEDREPIVMVRASREEYMRCTHHDQVQAIAWRSVGPNRTV